MTLRTLPIVAAALLVLAAPAWADDWPQWQGPNRDNVSKEAGLLKSWSKEGPKLLWTYEAGGIGYSGPAIVGDRLYVLGDRDDAEFVIALDIKSLTNGTIKEAWAAKIGPAFSNRYGGGSRSTPTVDGDRLYVLAACGSSSKPNDSQGELACLEKATGSIVWQKSLKGDLNGQMMSGWGYSESPLVDGDKLICSPGGTKGTLAALDKKTGEVIWRSKELTDPAAYSSIIAAEVGGVRQYIQTTGRAIVGVRANDGKLLWRHVKSNYRTAVIPTPIFYDNCVYSTAGYGVGCDLLKLTPDGQGTKAEEIYDKDAMRAVENKHEAVVRVGEHIFGWTERGGKWVCQEFKTGKIVWESKKLGRGSITCADGRLYCFGEHDGTVVLIEASPEGWNEHGRFTIPAPKMPKPRVQNSDNVWTHPVVANGRLYLRDQNYIYCYDVKAN